MKSFEERIADNLVSARVLSAEQLSDVLKLQAKQGGRLLKVLRESNLVTEQDLMVSMGKCLGTPPVTLAKLHVPQEILDLVPKDMALSQKMVAVSLLGQKLFVAMADPLNVVALDNLRRAQPDLKIVPLISTEKAVADFLQNANSQVNAGIDEILKKVDVSEDVEFTKEGVDDINLDRLVEGSEEAPVIKLVNLILAQAIKEQASDIHLESFEKTMRLRYRIDGVLYDMPAPPKTLQAVITSRIKIMASLDVAERRLPQDGRFRIKLSGKEVDLRISILPTVFGEKVVMRVLDKSALSLTLENLGLPPSDHEKFRQSIDAPHGMMLMSGPTGSGKTTTLYVVLSALNTEDVNIVTIEDPVEYQVTGVNQVQVKPEIGLTFAGGLRSILRQDPDIVMVGEIRDSETADIAVKAALTGHLVLSTLHTNDAPGVVARLIDMGIEPFLVASSLLMACAQRLVRKLCPHCKEIFQVPSEAIKRWGLQPNEVADNVFYRGRGCSRCKETGYRGRLPILEVMTISNEMKSQILLNASAQVIKEIALQEGMRTLRMAGLEKAKAGLTALDEVFRMAGTET